MIQNRRSLGRFGATATGNLARKWSAASLCAALGLAGQNIGAGEPPTEKVGSETTRSREKMVSLQIEKRGVRHARVLAAMRKVLRHELVPQDVRRLAYEDHPIPIGYGQTISQPYIVAAMTELLQPEPTDRILEIGTGSGYQAAVLAELVEHVYTIEIVKPLATRARDDLARLGYKNVTVIAGDGFAGLPDEAPFDGIIVTAAPKEIPPPLIEQLKLGGRLVIPVGDSYQQLMVVQKTEKGIVTEKIFDVRFVPMTGEAQEP